MITLGPLRPVRSVLCLGAHPDDIEIGCGGALLALTQERSVDVQGVVLSASAQRAAEARTAFTAICPASRLDVFDLPDGRMPKVWGTAKETLESVAAHCRPDLVFAPRCDDAHQDHRLLGELTTTVWRDALVLHYEIPKWDGDLGRPDTYVSLSPQRAQRKVDVLNECYVSQRGRHWWDTELFLGLMRLRGMESRTTYAEAFYTTKCLFDPSGAGHDS